MRWRPREWKAKAGIAGHLLRWYVIFRDLRKNLTAKIAILKFGSQIIKNWVCFTLNSSQLLRSSSFLLLKRFKMSQTVQNLSLWIFPLFCCSMKPIRQGVNFHFSSVCQLFYSFWNSTEIEHFRKSFIFP